MDDGIPPFLTVEEAGRLLRIGRTKAYDLTKEWRATGGRSGLPVVDSAMCCGFPARHSARCSAPDWPAIAVATPPGP